MGVPISTVGGTRTHDPTPPRRGYPLAEGDPKGALAGVQRIIRPCLGRTIALAPRRNAPKRSGGKVPKARRSRPQWPAGKRNCRGVFESRTPTPNAAAPRLLGQRLSLGLMGTHLTQRPKRRGAAGLVSFSLSFLRRLRAPKSAFLSLSFRFQFPAAAFFRRFLFRFSAATHHQPPNKPVREKKPLTTTNDDRG